MKQANQAICRSHLLLSILAVNPQGIERNRILEMYEDNHFSATLRMVHRDIEDLDAAGFEFVNMKGTGKVCLSRESLKQAEKASSYRTNHAEEAFMKLAVSYFEKMESSQGAALLNRSCSRLFSTDKTGLAVNDLFADNLEDLYIAINEKSLVEISFSNGEPSQIVRPVNLELSKNGSIILETSKQQFFALSTISSVEIVDYPSDMKIVSFPESFSQAA